MEQQRGPREGAPRITSISFSGAATITEASGGGAVSIFGSADEAVEAGVSERLAQAIFKGEVVECANRLTDTHFWCYDTPDCRGNCVIMSAYLDGSDERQEEGEEAKDADGKSGRRVETKYGRIYWCPCS